jgi:hypothetical protein
MEVTYTLPYTYMSERDHSASLSVGHRCLGTQVPDRGLAEVLTSPNKSAWGDKAGGRRITSSWGGPTVWDRSLASVCVALCGRAPGMPLI